MPWALASMEGDTPGQNEVRALDQFIRGTVADQMQDYYRAVFHYQEALRYDSSSAFLRVALAQDYILLGNPTLAEEFLGKALAVEPESVPALELKALLLRGKGRLKDARDCLRKLTEIAPRKAEYLHQLLAVELGLRDYKAVDQTYSEIVRLKANSPFLDRQMLSAFLSAEEYSRAMTHLQRMVAEDSTDPSLIYTLGTLYLQKHDEIQGEQLIRRAHRMNPKEPRYWIGLALIMMDKRDYASAEAIADSALQEISAPSAVLLDIKGNALVHLGRDDEAVQVLEQAIEQDTTLFSAIGTLALVYDRLDSLDRTVSLYEQAIRLSDSAAVYLNNLAYTYAERGIELDRAKSLAVRALQADRKNASYLDTMGWIEFRLGRYDKAIYWLKRAKKFDPSSAPILEHLGDVYTTMGKISPARIYYRKALENDPENETLRKKYAP